VKIKKGLHGKGKPRFSDIPKSDGLEKAKNSDLHNASLKTGILLLFSQ